MPLCRLNEYFRENLRHMQRNTFILYPLAREPKGTHCLPLVVRINTDEPVVFTVLLYRAAPRCFEVNETDLPTGSMFGVPQ